MANQQQQHQIKNPLIQRQNVVSPGLKDRVLAYIGPAVLMASAIYHHIRTFISLFFHLPPRVSTLLSPSKIQSLSFSSFWLSNAERLSLDMPPELTTLLSSPDDDDSHHHISGRVLDLGPGSGSQLHRYDFSKATQVYGIEPAEELHEELRKEADRVGVGEKYRILGCGAQVDDLIPALAKEGLLGEAVVERGRKREKKVGKPGYSGAGTYAGTVAGAEEHDEGIFDTIVSLRVLCGVPDQETTIDGLYRLLKPGGKFIFHEHVVVPKRGQQHGSGPAAGLVGCIVARLLQEVYMLMGWRFWMGGCCLTRDTGKVLLEAGTSGSKTKRESGWKEVHVTTLNPWSTVPYVVGYLVKK